MAQATSQARPAGRAMEMAGLAPAIGQSAAQVVWAVPDGPAVSRRWDWYVPQGTGRKAVWALLQGRDSR